MKVFFLPGLASGRHDYEMFLRILEREYDVYTIDMFPYPSISAAADAAVDFLERNSILLGYCFGSRVALILNARSPERILGNLFFTPIFATDDPWVRMVHAFERMYFRFLGWNAAKKLARAASFALTFDPGTLRMLNPPDRYAEAIHSAAGNIFTPFKHLLPSVVTPVYVHVETFDHVAPAPSTLHSVRYLPSPKRVNISLRGHHLVPITRPEYAARITIDGLRWIEAQNKNTFRKHNLESPVV